MTWSQNAEGQLPPKRSIHDPVPYGLRPFPPEILSVPIRANRWNISGGLWNRFEPRTKQDFRSLFQKGFSSESTRNVELLWNSTFSVLKEAIWSFLPKEWAYLNYQIQLKNQNSSENGPLLKFLWRPSRKDVYPVSFFERIDKNQDGKKRQGSRRLRRKPTASQISFPISNGWSYFFEGIGSFSFPR